MLGLHLLDLLIPQNSFILNFTIYILPGDINRAEHQKQRGGGTVCQNSIQVAKVYRKSINQFEPCGRNLL